MKTTVDLPEEELAEAMRHTKAKTKTEAVSLAVADYNRRQRLAKLADKLGTFKAEPRGSGRLMPNRQFFGRQAT